MTARRRDSDRKSAEDRMRVAFSHERAASSRAPHIQKQVFIHSRRAPLALTLIWPVKNSVGHTLGKTMLSRIYPSRRCQNFSPAAHILKCRLPRIFKVSPGAWGHTRSLLAGKEDDTRYFDFTDFITGHDKASRAATIRPAASNE